MKKSFLYIFFLLLTIFSINVNARDHYQGPSDDAYANSFVSDPNSPYVGAQKLTVNQLKPVHDDDYVILEGYIVKKIRGETYLFRDSTGEIQLDIDHKINYMLEGVNEKTLVQIYGEYDKNMFEPDEIEVKSLKIVKK